MGGHPTVRLNDGNAMPQLGLGVFKIDDREAARLVGLAIAAGYRAIDTAAMYGNEAGVGQAVRESPVGRDALFVTTKLWNDNHGYDRAMRACEASLTRLGLSAIDLYLIHWPAPTQNLFVETWRALIALQADGRVRSIGVSNFREGELERLIGETGVVPAVNQIELHPHFQQTALRAFHTARGIATESWSPLGRGRLLDEPLVARLATDYAKSPAQVIIRWHLQHGLIAIPKSADPVRIKANADVFDFTLDAADMAAIDGLDRASGRYGPDPKSFG